MRSVKQRMNKKRISKKRLKTVKTEIRHKKKKLLLFVKAWMNPESITLSEVGQGKKNTDLILCGI